VGSLRSPAAGGARAFLVQAVSAVRGLAAPLYGLLLHGGWAARPVT